MRISDWSSDVCSSDLARIAYARQTAASQRETEALTRVRFEAGAAAEADVANATGQANNTEANIPSLEAAYASAVHRLGVLTGRPPAALKDRLAAAVAIPAPDRKSTRLNSSH